MKQIAEKKVAEDVKIEKKTTQNNQETQDDGQNKTIQKNKEQQKRLDYRIKAFKSLLDAVRTGRQFITQKLIRRLRSNSANMTKRKEKSQKNDKEVEEDSENEKQKEEGEQNGTKKLSQAKLDRKGQNRQKNLEKRLENFKNMTTVQQKAIALYLEQKIMEIDIDKVEEYFLEHVEEDFKSKISEVEEEVKKGPENSFISFFVEQIKTIPKYKSVCESIQNQKKYISKILETQKIRKQKKKENFNLKQQNKVSKQTKEGELNNGDEEANEKNPQAKSQKQQQQNNDNNEVTKKINKTYTMNDKQKDRLKRWQEKRLRTQNSNNPSERSQFKKKGGREQRMREKLEQKVQKNRSFADEAKQQQQQSNYKTQQQQQQPQELHPSWAAKLEQKKKEANIHTFAGTKKKL